MLIRGLTTKKILSKRILRLAAASSLNTTMGVGTIGILYELTKRPYIALTMSAFLGYIYSIYSYNAIGFERGASRPPYKRYFIVYASGLAANTMLTQVGLHITGNFLAIQLFVLPLVVSLQWLASCLWAFRSQK